MTDWNKYKNTFPTRYLEQGYFDEYIKKIISETKPKTILDIGGGVTGTTALVDSGAKVYLLDPFVTNKPDWIFEKINWDTVQQFDLVVARGSINYLTTNELLKINKLISPEGTFIANTFLNQPKQEWSERLYVNTLGEEGTERSRYNLEKQVIEHELVTKSGEVISHTFFYHSPDIYKKIFPGINITEYKTNSAILHFRFF
ncbi:MAG: hypothetical protein V4690_01900 [Patescibacteria group bacterium]